MALIAVQRKLLILMYPLWITEKFYDAAYEIKSSKITKSLLRKITI